jgi:DNA-binding NtrC family response regulator
LLVVDDDQAGCRLVKAIFTADGFEVHAAHDGPAGLERARADKPDLVILDLQLPGLDGIEVLQRLKDQRPDLPVVMLTAHAEVRTAVRATQLGAFDYLTKPVDADEIVVVVRRALEMSALRAEVETLRRRVADEGGLEAQMGPPGSSSRSGPSRRPPSLC